MFHITCRAAHLTLFLLHSARIVLDLQRNEHLCSAALDHRSRHLHSRYPRAQLTEKLRSFGKPSYSHPEIFEITDNSFDLVDSRPIMREEHFHQDPFTACVFVPVLHSLPPNPPISMRIYNPLNGVCVIALQV
jgi:hypothetical protein